VREAKTEPPPPVSPPLQLRRPAAAERGLQFRLATPTSGRCVARRRVRDFPTGCGCEPSEHFDLPGIRVPVIPDDLPAGRDFEERPSAPTQMSVLPFQTPRSGDERLWNEVLSGAVAPVRAAMTARRPESRRRAGILGRSPPARRNGGRGAGHVVVETRKFRRWKACFDPAHVSCAPRICPPCSCE
jgi:hypothetical protein